MVRARRFRSLESDGSTSRQRPAEGGSRVWGSLDDSWGNYFPYINGKDRHHSHGSRHVYVDWVGSNRRRSRQDGTNRLWTSWWPQLAALRWYWWAAGVCRSTGASTTSTASRVPLSRISGTEYVASHHHPGRAPLCRQAFSHG